MKLHLVGGFLGSGKTTAIVSAARLLMRQGLRVGVITNDQGKYLVDTAFFRLSDLPAVEVTGGCFCCNYDDLDSRLLHLIETTHPDVIFAESVGSCADIVATVVNPLVSLENSAARPASFSVFADVRLLRRRLSGQEMPFSDDVVYIFDKQIEEAGILVVNKIDLVSSVALEEVREMLAERFPGKPVLFQTSLDEAGVAPWIELAQSETTGLPAAALEIDYERYGRGEAQLAWLDEEVQIQLPADEDDAALRQILSRLRSELDQRGAGIGHLKFIIRTADSSAKFSFTTLSEPDWESQVPKVSGQAVALLVNARVEMAADELGNLFEQILSESGCAYTRQNSSAFHPGFPQPTHRL
jgi:G3E family GTPase